MCRNSQPSPANSTGCGVLSQRHQSFGQRTRVPGPRLRPEDSLAGLVTKDSVYLSRGLHLPGEGARRSLPAGRQDKLPATIRCTALPGHLSQERKSRKAEPTTKVQADLTETKMILLHAKRGLGEPGERLHGLADCRERPRRPPHSFPEVRRRPPARPLLDLQPRKRRPRRSPAPGSLAVLILEFPVRTKG